MELVATCLFGLEKQLGEEIDALGLKRLLTMDGRIIFEGDEKDVARANIHLRLAEHVFIRMGHYPATTFTELFDGCSALKWEEWIGKDDAFPVKGHSIKSGLTSLPDCQSIIKKAVVSRLSSVYHEDWFKETGVQYQIEFFLFKDECDVMIDTSGVPLHKRGYRQDKGLAPLRETLAAALCLTARPRPDILFWDPMCGSGTIAIEYAMILKNIAPGVNRSFAGESFPRLPRSLWNEVRNDAIAQEKDGEGIRINASDVDGKMVKIAIENAQRAGVDDVIKFFTADCRTIQKPSPDTRGTIICNPPYGERLMDQKAVEGLYRDMGKHFQTLAPWAVYVLTSCETFERLYGKKADKIKALRNGLIPVKLYQFFKKE